MKYLTEIKKKKVLDDSCRSMASIVLFICYQAAGLVESLPKTPPLPSSTGLALYLLAVIVMNNVNGRARCG